jgi:hypothetical protein
MPKSTAAGSGVPGNVSIPVNMFLYGTSRPCR